jgi:formylglycine-generating enzyme required for sulfatase activity
MMRLSFAALAAWVFCSAAQADSFGAGSDAFAIPFVRVESPNNPPDQFLSNLDPAKPPSGGSVSYAYRLGKYEVSERMIDAANALGGLGITKDARGPDKPATSVSWIEAARFVNWLNTSTGHSPAYKITSRIVPGEPLPGRNGGTAPETIAYDFHLWLPTDSGYDPSNRFRNTQAFYFLPSHDEWYKAAYFDPALGVYYDYPTGSDTAPQRVAGGTVPGTAVYGSLLSPSDIVSAGGPSPFGTFAQGGNAYELLETEIDKTNDSVGAFRTGRGGAFDSAAANLVSYTAIPLLPAGESPFYGFRVASRIPEPSAASLIGSALLLVTAWRRQFVFKDY